MAFHLAGYVPMNNVQEHAMLDLDTFQTTVLARYSFCGLVLDLLKNRRNNQQPGAAEATTHCARR